MKKTDDRFADYFIEMRSENKDVSLRFTDRHLIHRQQLRQTFQFFI
jgi:hypothetical protein